MTRQLAQLLLTLAVATLTLPAQTPVQSQSAPVRGAFPAEGKEFWVVFEKNFLDFTTDYVTQAIEPAENLNLALFISSAENTAGYVEIPGLGIKQTFSVKAGTVTTVKIDSAAQLRSHGRVEKLGIHIVSNAPVTVSGLNSRFQTTDTYLAFPVESLGKTYRAMCYSWLANDLLAQFAVVAIEDSTTVTITPSARTRSNSSMGIPFTAVLNRGETYQVIPKYDPATSSDLTGSLITADKPIAVFSGHNCAYVPDPNVKACNHLVEQMPPVESWGRTIPVGVLAERSGSVMRVLASTDGTVVYENGHQVATLNAGKFYENVDLTRPVTITSNNPVLVAQYSKGYANGDSVGDPMMMILSPVESFVPAHRFSTPMTGSWRHYANIIAPTRAIGSVTLNGKPVDSTLFETLDGPYAIARIEVPFGLHTVRCAEPIGIYNYGFGYDESSYDAYGNGGPYRSFRRENR